MFDHITKFATENRPQRIEDLTGPLADNFTQTSNAVLDAVVDTNRRVVDVIVDAVGTVTERVAERVTIDARFGDALPTPAEAGARYLDFVEHAVGINRDWNQRIAEMIRSDAPQAASTVASTAKQTVAKKTPAKKRPAKKTPAKKTVAKKTPAKKSPAKKAASPSA